MNARMLHTVVITASFALGPSLVALSAAAQDTAPVARAVEEALEDERELRDLEVSVTGTEVTLRGSLPHLFAKNQAIERALAVDGVETVAAEITLPEAESDQEIAEEIARVVNNYPHYTLWDNVTGRVDQGVVTLGGSVTPDRDKKGDLYADVARIQGVQDYVDTIEVQSTSAGDQRLRQAIARNLFRSEHFERFSTMRNPPFHIVVNRSTVTLVGFVPTQIEYREMERIIAQMGGVLRVDNQLEVLRQ